MGGGRRIRLEDRWVRGSAETTTEAGLGDENGRVVERQLAGCTRVSRRPTQSGTKCTAASRAFSASQVSAGFTAGGAEESKMVAIQLSASGWGSSDGSCESVAHPVRPNCTFFSSAATAVTSSFKAATPPSIVPGTLGCAEPSLTGLVLGRWKWNHGKLQFANTSSFSSSLCWNCMQASRDASCEELALDSLLVESTIIPESGTLLCRVVSPPYHARVTFSN